MGPKRVDKDDSKGKERVDRREQSKYKFDPLRLEIKYPGTAILLLQCEEKNVLLAAAAALAKYGSKATENLEVLFDLKIVENVIPLIVHEDLFTRRFASKLLAEMVAIPNVLIFLLESNYYIPHFTKVLINDQDLFMQEFSSLILGEICNDPFGAAQMLKQCETMDFLFERIQSPDPDVKRNNITIIYNLLQDPTGAPRIMEAKNFNLLTVYKLYDSPYPEIQQLALDVVADLVSRNQNSYLQELFRQTNGLQALLTFLDNVEWEDLHPEVFRILRLATDNPLTADMFNDIGGIKRMLGYLEDTFDSKLFMQALDVAVRQSHTRKGRQMLYTCGIVDYLLGAMAGNVQPEIYEIICHGIGMMTLSEQAARELTASNCVKNILDIMKNESLKWSTRQAALFALNQLLKCDVKNCENFLGLQGQNYFLKLMKQPGKIPIEILVGVVESFIIMIRNQILRPLVVNMDLVNTMCASFELTCPSMDDFKIAICNAMTVLCVDKDGRIMFLKANGPSHLFNLLSDVKSIPIKNTTAQLVQVLCTDPVLADAFVSARYLNYMLKNRIVSRAIPSWETCIQALYNSHLPIKFAFTGRLSLHDITKDGFYVLRRNVCKFPVLDDILRFKYCPREPIYVVNCIQPRKMNIQEKLDSLLSVKNFSSSNLTTANQREIYLSTEIKNLMMDVKFGRLHCDVCLYDYIELFKCKLVAAESKDSVLRIEQGLINISYIVPRIKMLAKFVAQQMSGPDPVITCIDHQLEIHLKEIKAAIETSVIPLGMLRVGSFLERALLFKVIADRVHLPAALVRGEYGVTWIEVAVPQVKSVIEEPGRNGLQDDSSCPEFEDVKNSVSQYINDQEESRNNESIAMNRLKIYPTKLLKPNFIVDLMNKPGDLIPLDSRRAKMYCQKSLVCEKACQH